MGQLNETGQSTKDCISRQAAIDALKRDEEYDEDIPNRADGVRDAIITIIGLPSAQPYTEEEIQAMQDLEQAQLDKAYQIGVEEGLQSAQPAQPWIPCSERLPSARQSVILSTKEWTGEGCYWETTEHHVIWKGYRWNATYWDDEVIAWMPLPEAYKGEQP